MDNKYYGGMSDHKGENKIYFELNMKKEQNIMTPFMILTA